MISIEVKAGEPFEIGESASGIMLWHIFEQDDLDAIRAALLAKRPLLLRGEPGVGKSQLAKAAAKALKRSFHSFVVDSRTEARDLKWQEDIVARLADAQLVGGLRDDETAQQLRKNLDLKNYVTPGPLWWGFNWKTAQERAELTNAEIHQRSLSQDDDQGVVVLIDEIDKGGSEVPNGLLEALGSREFKPTGQDEAVTAVGAWPLIVITTNEERRLPNAFLRRCVVHDMSLPNTETAFINYLVERGRAYYPSSKDEEKLLEEAAEQTWKDRQDCEKQRLKPLPGQAEYLDLLRAVFSEDADPNETPKCRLNTLAPYFLRKHPELE